MDEVRVRVLPKDHPTIVQSREGVRLLSKIEHYIHMQRALGNWTEVWDGDNVIVALVDTYDALRLYEPGPLSPELPPGRARPVLRPW